MPFEFIRTKIDGLITVRPRVFADGRGFFMETYKHSDFKRAGVNEVFVQDNHSCSAKGVLRGLHFQKEPHAQGKLVGVVRGSVWDVAVDLRSGSATRLQWYGQILSEENKIMAYIPPGFAHGFLTLEDDTHFLYKCTAEYSPDSDAGVRWDDPELAVDWPLELGQVPDVSPKDAVLPYFKDFE